MSLRVRELRDYAYALACVALSSVCAFVAEPYAQHADLEMIYLLGIVLFAARFSVRVSLFACLVTVVVFDYVFVEPKYGFASTDVESWLTFIAMFVVAFVISSLNQQLRKQERVARTTAFKAEALYELNSELSTASDARQLSAIAARHLERLFGAPATIVLRGPKGGLGYIDAAADPALAERAYVRRELSMTTQPDGKCTIWLPVAGIHAPLGVVGLHGVDGVYGGDGFAQSSVQTFLLTACVNQFATALERSQLSQAVHRTQVEAETERLRSSLLSAVSHDLKTPLSTIIAAGTILLDRKRELDPSSADGLLRSIVDEGDRLNRLLHNLLSFARLESPTIELRRSPESIEDVVAAAVERFESRIGTHRLRTELQDDLPLIWAEPLLLEQVLTNLLENAARYAGPDAKIVVDVVESDGAVTVRVADDGPGIPEDERYKVFEKFYRGRLAGNADGGAGLGLTICRAIIQAHGGRIGVRERNGGGTLVEFTVPLAAAGRTETSRKEAAAS